MAAYLFFAYLQSFARLSLFLSLRISSAALFVSLLLPSCSFVDWKQFHVLFELLICFRVSLDSLPVTKDCFFCTLLCALPFSVLYSSLRSIPFSLRKSQCDLFSAPSFPCLLSLCTTLSASRVLSVCFVSLCLLSLFSKFSLFVSVDSPESFVSSILFPMFLSRLMLLFFSVFLFRTSLLFL